MKKFITIAERIFFILIGLAIVAFIAYKGKNLLEVRKAEIVKEPTPQKRSVSVTLTQAKQGTMRETQAFLAQVQSDKSIKIATKMAGYIKQVFVEESQWVEKGKLLAVIDQSDIDSNIAMIQTTIAQQQNDLALAEQIYKRNQKLYEVGGLAREQVDIARVTMQGKRSAIAGSQQKIAQLKEQKNYLKIKAPFSGEVDTLFMQQGDLAVTGKPILSMSNGTKKLVFSFVASENKIKKGQALYIDHQEIGKVKKILTLAKQGLVQAEVALNKKLNLPVGVTQNIDVLIQYQKGCIVPNTALLHKREGTYVMSYIDSKFQAQKVESRMNQDNQTMITPCPTAPIAVGSEVLLAKLPVYGEVEIR